MTTNINAACRSSVAPVSLARTTPSTMRFPTHAIPAGSTPATALKRASEMLSPLLVAQTSLTACDVYLNTPTEVSTSPLSPCPSTAPVIGPASARR